MAKKIINIGQTANDKSGDPLRTAFTKINENFTELYSAIGADVQIPIQTNNGGKFLTTNGTTLSWVNISQEIGTGNTGFVDDKIYNINGPVLSNDDLVHGATARLALPAYGETDPVSLLNYYGGVTVTAGLNPSSTVGWTFNNTGTLTVPYLLPKTFTAVLDTDHMVDPTALSDAPWEFDVSFQVNPNGDVETQIGNNTPWLNNPGYADGKEFTYTEADHGIPGYTFTLGLTGIQHPGEAGWTTNLLASPAPTYASTINTDGAIKLTSNNNDWILGTLGDTTFPTSGNVYFPNSLKITQDSTTSIFGKSSSTTQTEEIPGGTVSTTLTQESQVEIAPTSVIIARRSTQVVDDGVVTTTDVAGTQLEISNGIASLKLYQEPDGPNNSAYTQVKATSGGAIVEAVQQTLGGNVTGRITVQETNVSVLVGDGVTDHTWTFRNDGVLQVPGPDFISWIYQDEVGLALQVDGHPFKFGKDGNITLPAGGDIKDSTGTSVLGGGGGNANTGTLTFVDNVIEGDSSYVLGLSPHPTFTDGTYTAAPGPELGPQYLRVRGGDNYEHIHFDTSNNSAFDLYVGDDYKYFKLSKDGPAVIGTSGLQNHTWTFGTGGLLSLGSDKGAIYADQTSGAVTIADYLGANGEPAMPSSRIMVGGDEALVISRGNGTNNPSWTFGDNGSLTVPGAITKTSGNLDITAENYVKIDSTNGGQIDIGANQADGTTNSGTIMVGHAGNTLHITSGKLRISATTPPTHSTGAVGDVAGLVAFDSNYFYYCTAAYGVTGHQVTVATLWNGATAANTNSFQLTRTDDTLQITVGDTISDGDGGATSTVVSVSSDANYTYVGTGGMAYNANFPLTFTSTSPAYVPGGNIWKRVAWGGGTW